MPEITDADMMAMARTHTANAINRLKAHSAPVGSVEANRASAALNHLGMAYGHLSEMTNSPGAMG